MLREMGFCNGIENYSMHIDGRTYGEPPFTLLDYFPDDFLLVIDESHQAVPQLHGQYEGDRSRKDMKRPTAAPVASPTSSKSPVMVWPTVSRPMMLPQVSTTMTPNRILKS